MKVLLVTPLNKTSYGTSPDLGLGYLATSLRKKGHSVNIINCQNERISFKKLENYIASIKPDVVGFKIHSTDLLSAKRSLVIVKEIDPSIITIIGGPHPSCIPSQEVMDYFSEADFAFKGEAEIGLPLLVDELPRPKPIKMRNIPGLIYRDNEKAIANAPIFVEDLDDLGLPSWDLIDPRKYKPSMYFTKHYLSAPMVATRGCPYRCTFCSAYKINGKQIRTRSVEHLWDEIQLLYHQFGIKEIDFVDDNFAANKSFVIEFCTRLIKKGSPVTWSCISRLNHLNKEIILLMAKSGCHLITAGIESGSQRILDRMKKETTIEEIEEKIFLIKRSTNIKINGTFIIGYPEETEKEILKTIRFAKKLPLYSATFYSFQPIPGTPIYNELLKKEKIKKEIDYSLYGDYKKSFPPEGISHRRFIYLHRRALVTFYLRPKILYNLLKDHRTFTGMKFLFIRAVSRLLKY